MIARASNQFGIELWRRCDAGNFTISPASIASTLAMVWTGAAGDTATEIQRVLRLDDDVDAVARMWGTLSAELRRSPGIQLAVAYRLFGEKSYTFDPVFQARLADAFGAPMESADFVTAASAVTGRINAWVAEQTRGKIAKLLEPSALDHNTRLVLVNAIYFLGTWREQFRKPLTRPAPFWISATQSKTVDTMHQTASFRAGVVPGGHIIELPYQGDSAAMYIVMPEERDGLANIERDLDATSLGTWIGQLAAERVALALPKFTIAPPVTRLDAALKQLGIALAYDLERADFSNMAKPTRTADELVLSAVFHRAFVQVDEEGTVAAAATAAVMTPRGGAPRTRNFTIDRPFLFFITDKHSGLVLFIGRVVDP